MSSLIIFKGEFLDMEITCPPELAQEIQREFLANVRKYPVTVRVKMIDIKEAIIKGVENTCRYLDEVLGIEDYERDDQRNPT